MTVTTNAARLWVDERGIAHIQSTGVPSTAATVEESLTALQQLLGGTRAPILFDARQWPSGDTASWVRFISLIEQVCVAGAILVDPERPAALGRFPEFLSKLIVPFAVFTREADALAFLELHTEDAT